MLFQLLQQLVMAYVFRQHSVYGLLHWSCRRLVEGTLTRYGDIIAGTWGMNTLYRAFGARIGSLCAIRNKAPGMNIPDMLQLNNKCGWLQPFAWRLLPALPCCCRLESAHV